ncbi:coiled-coil domain-containing protein 102A-like isoform X1 [Chiloscyllium plagiosum]|uniref:coiled-coil domain-containing protein 102A-like isoform X1 n=1 Tax=Chiloscyllium plagiosum TaxID=36176 RepID=UPI001CB835E4|nr:coiled-coil domain-containing protein 102A-like isoform X1 [Chiloscyllium plagiosum]XP_043544410.1 coiled-coil domain-containing protein 102A-like isoform X1 [Chiloscyllium plagiosum]XP_043544411.1 coiled-coil domain-containing protein 102A-like isoform X1 [Chiloscyllium plagiosum]
MSSNPVAKREEGQSPNIQQPAARHLYGQFGQGNQPEYMLSTDSTVHRVQVPPQPAVPQQLARNMAICSDWDSIEGLYHRELEEVRARAAQMEKTMRWWSDCTANWREKWSKVRAERNKAREEVRQTRQKLESVVKELAAMKREKQELLDENEGLRREATATQTQSETLRVGLEEDEVNPLEQEPVKDVENNNNATSPNIFTGSPNKGFDIIETILKEKPHGRGQGLESSATLSLCNSTICAEKAKLLLEDGLQPFESDSMKAIALQFRLDESQKILQREREDKATLERQIEKLEADICQWKDKYEDLNKSKQEILKQLTFLRDAHQNELGRISEDLEDEVGARSNMDRKLADLRTELERLQAENTAEWGKRERLETEKLSLERDNKKLKVQIEDMEKLLAKRSEHNTNIIDSDFKAMQCELFEKNKELSDFRHAHNKLKKQYQDKLAEFTHSNRRVEQHEAEVKKLRLRVEELKKELAHAEDELDESLNQIRKLQRSLDEQTELNDNLQVQFDHLQTRLRRQQTSSLFGMKLSSAYNPDDSAETISEEDDLELEVK